MTETVTETTAPASPEADVQGPDFAAMLAARLCHDFISPASAIVSGLDLLEDPSAQDMRDDAMNLIASSARKLADLLQFTRVAFGASASAENFDSRELEKLAQGVFAHVRPTLDWQIEPQAMNKPSSRLRPEVLAGLKGEPLAEGLGGPWVQAAYLNALVRAAGGQIAVEIGEDRASIAAWVPA